MGGNGFTDREAGQLTERMDNFEDKQDETIEAVENLEQKIDEKVIEPLKINTIFRKISLWAITGITVPIFLAAVSYMLRGLLL